MNTEELKRIIRNRTVVELEMPESSYDGLRCVVLRQSKQTGGLTIELTESRELHRQGTTHHVKPYEVRFCTTRPAEAQSALIQCQTWTVGRLERFVAEGLNARKSLIDKIMIDQNDTHKQRVECLTHEMEWGHGVEEDILAGLAGKVLYAIKDGEHQLVDVLKAIGQDLTRQATRNIDGSPSSNPFSNAVRYARRSANAKFIEFCEMSIGEINRHVGEMAVL